MSNKGIEGLWLLERGVCSLDQSLILPTARKVVWENSWSHQQGRVQEHLTEKLVTGILRKQWCVRASIAHRSEVIALWQRLSKSMKGETMLWELGFWNSCYVCFYRISDAFGMRTLLECELLRLHVSALQHHWGCHGIQAFDKNPVHFEVVIRIALDNATKAWSLSNHAEQLDQSY